MYDKKTVSVTELAQYTNLSINEEESLMNVLKRYNRGNPISQRDNVVQLMVDYILGIQED